MTSSVVIVTQRLRLLREILDPIRKWFAGLPESKLRGLTAAHFSYRRREGRCEVCGGSGLENDELERYRVVSRSCRVCDGSRYGSHIALARYKGLRLPMFST